MTYPSPNELEHLNTLEIRYDYYKNKGLYSNEYNDYLNDLPEHDSIDDLDDSKQRESIEKDIL